MHLNKEWKDILYPQIDMTSLKKLEQFIKGEYKTKTIYPKDEDVFNALNSLPVEKVNVVIIGQDPYHEPGQAHGYAFSVLNGEPPPSLLNIYKEIEDDVGFVKDKSGNLTHWAEQGVLLLNTVLTVRKGQANSHKGVGWEALTLEVVKTINKMRENVVFILWGKNAREYESFIDQKKHLVLESVHPSPLSAYAGFFGSKHFSKTNVYLKEHGKKEIVW